MPQLSEIRDWVRQQTLVESDDMADSKVDAVINQGLRDLSTRTRWPWLVETATIPLVNAQQSYNLPTNLLSIDTVLLSNRSEPLQEVSTTYAFRNWGTLPPTATTPSAFYLWGSTLRVLPVPASPTQSLVMYYYKRPTLLSNDTDQPAFDPQFHLILAYYAAWHLWEREEDFEKGRALRDAYYEGVERMGRHYNNRSKDALVLGEGTIAYGRGPRQPWLEV